jgi:hypothetical protein
MSKSSPPKIISKPQRARCGAKGVAMSKITIVLLLAALAPLGCRSVGSVNVIETPEPPMPLPEPSERGGIIARTSHKDFFTDSSPPLDQARPGVAKTDHAEKARVPTVGGKLKPAEAAKKKGAEKAITANPPVPLSGIPRDVWYAIATICGALFTSILGPIVVEIIRERMAVARQQTAKQQNVEA